MVFTSPGGVVPAVTLSATPSAIHVWRGGASVTGAPTFTLAVAGAVANDRLGNALGQALQLGDVTGDGVFDLVAGAQTADVGGVVDAGAVHVWRGGPTLASGNATFTLTVPGAAATDQLGDASGQGVRLGDVTGDGVLDLIAAAQDGDVGGVANTGALYLWRGGATLAGPPDGTLTVTGAVAGDQLGN